jgi:lipooligosaccharide transport system ATP-binding protein
MPPPVPVVALSGVVKRFGDLIAVDGVDLRIERGTCYALLGPNGAGKSTLSRIIGGVSPRDGGDVQIFGMDPWTHQVEVKTRLGVVPQEDGLDEELDVLRNLHVYGLFFGLQGPAFREKAARLLDFMELTGREKTRVVALSGGMRQRLSIARGLLNDPEFVILDEPTTGLDPQVRHAIWAAMRRLRAQGTTILLTTHYMEEAAQLADVVGILHGGRLVAEDTPDALIRDHLPSHVVETEADSVDADPPPDALAERHGDRLFVFHDDQETLLEWAAHHASGRTLARTASLEDVFLKLTGRSLDA